MFITGLGIGPTLSVFTIIVQNAVPFQKLGVATSNLTFFRQVGGSVGLALLGTVLGQRLTEELPGRLVTARVPAELAGQLAGNAGGAERLIVVGEDLGSTILAAVPAPARAIVEPLIPNIVQAIHDAFTIAMSSTFLIGVLTTVAAFVAALAMRELPLRTTMGHGHSAARDPRPEGQRAEAPRVEGTARPRTAPAPD
jgi:hypothetical protein